MLASAVGYTVRCIAAAKGIVGLWRKNHPPIVVSTPDVRRLGVTDGPTRMEKMEPDAGSTSPDAEQGKDLGLQRNQKKCTTFLHGIDMVVHLSGIIIIGMPK